MLYRLYNIVYTGTIKAGIIYGPYGILNAILTSEVSSVAVEDFEIVISWAILILFKIQYNKLRRVFKLMLARRGSQSIRKRLRDLQPIPERHVATPKYQFGIPSQ